MTAVLERPVEPGAEPPRDGDDVRRPLSRWWGVLGVVAVWIGVWAFTKGQDTLALAGLTQTDLHNSLTGFRDDVLAARDSNPLIRFTYGLGGAFVDAVTWLQQLISVPARPRPVPEVGWLGVTAVAAWIGLAVAGWRIAILVAASFLSFGAFGYWTDSIDLLIVTFVSVVVCVLVGMPLAVLVGTNRVANAGISTFLDLMQTLPTFVYLLPIVLFFGIGASGAVVCTLIYALPPIIRIAGHGIREVSVTTIEATDSSGQTSWQRLLKVQLPMARRTIIVGLNQTIMAALSMATLAAFVDGPGLGDPVLTALRQDDVGGAFVPGALIVLMAVMLDRTTTAASERNERVARGHGGDPRKRLIVLAAGGVGVLVAIYVSRLSFWAAEFPELTWGRWVADRVDSFFGWVVDTFRVVTSAITDLLSYGLLNPMESVLAESPWWLAGLGILALAFVLGGPRVLPGTLVCLAGLWFFDLWHSAMITLNMVLVATLLVMALALVFGVWMARSLRADLVLRPVLDAGQTIPPFVYLIPVLALFGTTRFTAIIAAIVYAAPAAIKLVADGVKRVSPTTMEACRSTGATRWQEITQVQLPMAKASLVLAANQGLLYVLSMVVIGGLVGAGGLGFDVVFGFARSEQWGKGAAAGISIVLLGIMLDRIARAAAQGDRGALGFGTSTRTKQRR